VVRSAIIHKYNPRPEENGKVRHDNIGLPPLPLFQRLVDRIFRGILLNSIISSDCMVFVVA